MGDGTEHWDGTKREEGQGVDPCVIYANCQVYYDGRASSSLRRGNYLVIIKSDSSIAVHGASLASKPLNYQRGGSEIDVLLYESPLFDDMAENLFDERPKFIIRAVNGPESLVVGVYKTMLVEALTEWDDNRIELVRSERDLVTQVFDDIYGYFPDLDIVVVETELDTPYGKVDIAVLDSSGVLHVIEVKRKTVSLAGCGQLARYARHFSEIGIETRQLLMAPAISKGAATYCSRNGQTWIEVQFR